MKSKSARYVIAIGIVMTVWMSALHAQQNAKKEHTFRGKVEQVDTKAKSLTVNGENVEGWMSAMTMTYTVDKPEVVNKVKVGDQIVAKVYDGDFKTLHDVQVVSAKDKK